MRRSRTLVIAVPLALAACTPSATSDADGTSAATSPPSASTPGSTASSDTEFDVGAACNGLSDILTIVANAEAGLAEGRMAEQERDGWFHVATSILERLPSEGPDPVAESVAALQSVAPHDPGRYLPTAVSTQPWHDAVWSVYQACEASGHEPPTWMFTGG